MNIKDWEKEFKGMFWYSKEKAQILCFIRQLLSLQKQEIVEEIEKIIQAYLDKNAHLINEMDIGGDDKDIVVVDIIGVKDILTQLKQKLT